MKRFVLIRQIFIALFFGATVTRAAERIISFGSEITVRPDASMLVVETIRVHSEGRQIQHGIFRDFPTSYRDRAGHSYRVGFDVTSVRRDGQSEPFLAQELSNGKRVRIGRADVFLPPGDHVFEIDYVTSRQLGFFADHDELYWNVTGNGWDFPIDHATAVVRLPGTVPRDRIRTEAYTGISGSREKAVRIAGTAEGDPSFTTTRPLGLREGLTIVVGWPKGHVRQPTVSEQFGFLAHDNPGIGWAAAGLLALLGYFLIAWLLVGRDPPKGTIIPRFYPPEGYSPAACRFIGKMHYDHKCFAAALINLAVKGIVKLRETDRKKFTVTKCHPKEISVSPEEAVLYQKLLEETDSIALVQERQATIKSAVDAFKEALKLNYQTDYFATNRSWFFASVTILAATALAVVLSSPDRGVAIFFLAAGAMAGAMIMASIVAFIRAIRRSRTAAIFFGVFLIFVVLFFFFFFSPGWAHFSASISPVTALLFGGMAALAILFHHLLKRPTLAGRKVMDQIDGFRMYLGTAERESLAALNPPEPTPELFESYLPYALALDVEQKWAEQFADILAQAQQPPGQAGAYQPVWFSSDSHRLYPSTAAMATAVGGALSSAISSASTPPGSDSGFSGGGGGEGGSSGGGGGGGGGGGW